MHVYMLSQLQPLCLDPIAGGGSSECAVEVVNDGREVCVVWPGEEGQQSTYHATWLKYSCRCPLCWNKLTMQYKPWEQDPKPQGLFVGIYT